MLCFCMRLLCLIFSCSASCQLNELKNSLLVLSKLAYCIMHTLSLELQGY